MQNFASLSLYRHSLLEKNVFCFANKGKASLRGSKTTEAISFTLCFAFTVMLRGFRPDNYREVRNNRKKQTQNTDHKPLTITLPDNHRDISESLLQTVEGKRNDYISYFWDTFLSKQQYLQYLFNPFKIFKWDIF